MKSKSKQRKQKQATLIQEPQFKRSDGNRPPRKHRVITTNIANLTTNSSHGTGQLPILKQKSKDKDLSSKQTTNQSLTKNFRQFTYILVLI